MELNTGFTERGESLGRWTDLYIAAKRVLSTAAFPSSRDHDRAIQELQDATLAIENTSDDGTTAEGEK